MRSIVFLFVAGMMLFTAGCKPEGLQLPQAPGLGLLERKVGRIAYVGPDSNIYTIDQGGVSSNPVTSDAISQPGEDQISMVYGFPTWSPDGKRLAFVGIRWVENLIEDMILYTANSDGTERVNLYQSAERIPYLPAWSPDGEMLSFLSVELESDAATFHTVPSRGGEVRLLGEGNPFFWDWSPDNLSILIHRGGNEPDQPTDQLAIIPTTGGGIVSALDTDPGRFDSPAWSPNGQEVAFAVANGSNSDLVLADSRGKIRTTLASAPDIFTIDWSPQGDWLAYTQTSPDDAWDASPNPLTLVNTKNPNQKIRIKDEEVIGFFWAPNGRKVAYFSLIGAADESIQAFDQQNVVYQVQLKTIAVPDGNTLLLTSLYPTYQFLNVITRSDQFQESDTLWSPDSSNLVITSYNDEGMPGVYVLEAAGNLEPRRIADGNVGFWSAK